MDYNTLCNTFGKKFVPHSKNWGDKTDYTSAELIEMVSCWQEVDLLPHDINLCHTFVSHTVNNTLFSANLTFGEKCIVVKLLRESGYDILFSDLDTFPVHTTDMVNLIVPLSTINKFKQAYYQSIVSISRYRTLLEDMLLIVGLIMLPHTYLWYSVALTLILISIVLTYEHEYLSHKFIIPKTPFIDSVLFTTSVIWSTIMRNNSKIHVMHHHKHWKDPLEDEIEYSMNQGKIAHLLKLTDYRKFYMSVTNEVKYPLLTRFENYIPLAFGGTLLLLFNIEVAFYFWFVPWVAMSFIIILVSQVLQHGFYKTKEEPDFVFLLPVLGQLGNHISHHKTPSRAVWGTLDHDWLKWVNPHYYVYLLLFKDNK